MGVVPIELQGLESWIGCIIGLLLGLIVQGDAQEYFVHMFEAFSRRTKIELDFNPLHHFDPLSLPAILFAGWGWSKRRVEEPAYMPPSIIARSCIPLAGAIGSFALAGILGSFYWFWPRPLFEVAIAINIQIALANLLIPIPPLALGRALCRAFPSLRAQQPTLEFMGALAIAALVFLEYTGRLSLFDTWVMAPSAFITKWILIM